MKLPVILEKQASADAEGASAWYEEQRAGLGNEFLLELARTLDRMAHFPESYQPFRRAWRRAVLHRFDYAVIYRVGDTSIEVLAVMHCRRRPAPVKRSPGFSLIELSIVLVIISLLLGSILVGQDLIHAAAVRATVSQLEKYNTALDTFQKKYGYLPGDMTADKAGSLGFFAENGASVGAAGHGDGNGLLEGCATGVMNGCGETLSFWRHLTDAGLIDGNYGTSVAGNALDVATGQAPTAIPPASAGTLFPPARLGSGNYFTTYSTGGFNYYAIIGITAMATDGTYTLAYAMTPLDAQSIDAKTDDGVPLLGLVTAMGNGSLGAAAPTGAGTCVDNGRYTIANATANLKLCALGLRFQ